jgi:hypothetical protein
MELSELQYRHVYGQEELLGAVLRAISSRATSIGEHGRHTAATMRLQQILLEIPSRVVDRA